MSHGVSDGMASDGQGPITTATRYLRPRLVLNLNTDEGIRADFHDSCKLTPGSADPNPRFSARAASSRPASHLPMPHCQYSWSLEDDINYVLRTFEEH